MYLGDSSITPERADILTSSLMDPEKKWGTFVTNPHPLLSILWKILTSQNLQSPITKFAGVLSATLRSVVLALNAVAEKKAAQEN